MEGTPEYFGFRAEGCERGLDPYDRVLADTLTNGGGTWWLDGALTPCEPTSGYGVGVVGGESFPVDLAGPMRLRRIIRRLAHETLMAPLVGTWVHEGRVFVDPVVVTDSLANAIDIARANDQIAIWDFAGGKEITL